MVRATLLLAALSAGCGRAPTGGYQIVSWTVRPAAGDPRTVEGAGRLELGGLGHPDPDDNLECFDTADVCGDAVSVIAYHWVGGGLVPVWAPERVLFALPDWDEATESWLGAIPLGNLSCELGRESRGPTVLVGECTGPEGGPFQVDLTMDR